MSISSDVLHGRTIVVTGGGGTIGRAFVRAIASAGGIAIAADIDPEAAARSAEASVQGRGHIETATLDITDINSVRCLFADLRSRHGRIDGVVNNAYPRNPRYGRALEDVTYGDFCENLSLHLGGYFLIAQQACLAFVEQGEGVLVNMSSIYGSMTPRFDVYAGTRMTMPVEYAAIKAGVEHLTRYFAQYFKGKGVRVNSLSPGGILAEQPDAFLGAYRSHCASKGMLAPEDLCGALIFLLSDAAQHIQGQNLIVDDGFSL